MRYRVSERGRDIRLPFPAAELTRHHMENYLRPAMKERGRGAIKSSLEGWTAPNITKASSLTH